LRARGSEKMSLLARLVQALHHVALWDLRRLEVDLITPRRKPTTEPPDIPDQRSTPRCPTCGA